MSWPNRRLRYSWAYGYQEARAESSGDAVLLTLRRQSFLYAAT
jgi:hypothetical protein